MTFSRILSRLSKGKTSFSLHSLLQNLVFYSLNRTFASMTDDKEKKFLDKLRFAGEKVPSMKRRSNINDYYGRHIYMVTMAVEGRRPLLGTLKGSSTVAEGQ